MSKTMPTIWQIEPHTKAKHSILNEYFQSWLAIVGQKFQRIVYVDGFCGPGVYVNQEPGSPILVINSAEDVLSKLSSLGNLRVEKLELHFIDCDKGRIDSLNSELTKLSVANKQIEIKVDHGDFEHLVQPLVRELQLQRALHNVIVPSLFFIDPFGVKGFSLSLIGEIFKLNSSEAFLLFDVDGADRVLAAWDAANEKILLSIYGDTAKAELLQIKTMSDQKIRFQKLRELFNRSLRGQQIAGTMSFSMFDSSKRILYDLIFLTNAPTGFVKMKEAMWKVDSSGEFKFSDAEHGDQLMFSFPVCHEDNLWNMLLEKFRGQKVTGLEVKKHVLYKTIYLEKHKTAALKKHEKDDNSGKGCIIVSNRKRNYGYPDDSIIQFPS